MQCSTSNSLLTEAFVIGKGPIDTSQASNSAPWIEVARRRSRQRVTDSTKTTRERGLRGAVINTNARSRNTRPTSSGVLHGAGSEKTAIQPCHLSGISIDYSEDDVILYCRGKGIIATRCFLLPTRVWHGKCTAKLFAATSAKDKLLKNTLWPDHVACRFWESSPPGQNKSNLLM